MAERTEGDIKLPIHSVSMTALKVWNISILERVSQYHYFRITLVYNNFFVVSTTEIWEHHDLSWKNQSIIQLTVRKENSNNLFWYNFNHILGQSFNNMRICWLSLLYVIRNWMYLGFGRRKTIWRCQVTRCLTVIQMFYTRWYMS